ncbi:MAG: lipid-A-disaccharide synthase-related protein [Thainema sp.]
MKLLCLSNGHGEDIIGLRILQALQQQAPELEIAALPIVGEGLSYQRAEIPIIGAVKPMPSGGFIYMDGRQLARDLQGGLLALTRSQLKTIRAWAKEGGFILAVGDIVPLLFAWLSRANYAFVGTAKSEYYLRDEVGWLPRDSWVATLENWSGSVYLPWERWLMGRKRCQAIFPRDSLTSHVLQAKSLPAYDLGNPMMDGLVTATSKATDSELHNTNSTVGTEDAPQPLTVVLLPGSRPPEAYHNWQTVLTAGSYVMRDLDRQSVRFLAAIAPSLDLAPLRERLEMEGWRPDSTDALTYIRGASTLTIATDRYAEFLQQADFAIAMAGTATEQFVGLGKPALILPGTGPQFTPRFAEAQTRLLGPSVTLIKPEQAGQVVQNFLTRPDLLQLVAENGQRRMGAPGAAARIAACLREKCLALESKA